MSGSPSRVTDRSAAGGAGAPVRVYVPTTVPALGELLAEALAARAGQEVWAATPAAREALVTAGDLAGARPDEVTEELAELLLGRAADASVSLLAAAPAGAFVPALRVVVVCELPPGPLVAGEPAGRATLAADVSWSRAQSVMTDDEAAAPSVAEAVARLRAGDRPERALAPVDELTLSWFDASEAAHLLPG